MILVNAPVKARIVAKDLLKGDGLAIAASAGFVDVEIDGDVHTTIRFAVLT